MTAQPHLDSPFAGYPADARARPAWAGAALSRQLALYQRLDALSRSQSAVIGEDDTDRLLGILGERQVVVDEIAEIGAALGPLRGVWEAFLSDLPEGTREQLRGLVDALAELAGLIAARDEGDRRCLEARRAAVGEELASVARGRSAVLAYGGRVGTVPFFQDREG